MSHLVVAVFNDDFRAQQAMSEMVRLYKPRPDLENALLLTWNGSDPIAQQSQNLAERSGAGWGMLWGSLLRSVISGTGEIEAAVSSLRGVNETASEKEKRQVMDLWTSGIRLSQDFFRDVEALVTPGRSAIFFVSRSPTLGAVEKVTRGYGGTLLSVPLTGQHLAKIRKFLRAHSAH